MKPITTIDLGPGASVTFLADDKSWLFDVERRIPPTTRTAADCPEKCRVNLRTIGEKVVCATCHRLLTAGEVRALPKDGRKGVRA